MKSKALRKRKLSAEDLRRVEEATERVQEELAALVKPIRESKRITGADLAIIINARDND